jgi:hypothetical protein
VSDEQIVTDRKISVSFTRKISDGNYGSIEATAWVQGDAAVTDTPGAVSVKLGDLMQAASVAVWEQLGVPYEADPEGVLREAAPQPTVQAAQAAVERILPASRPFVVDGAIRIMNPKESDGDVPAWLVDACAKDGITAVWDQRRTATGRQPLFKEAVAKGAVGHGKDGTPKGFWPN